MADLNRQAHISSRKEHIILSKGNFILKGVKGKWLKQNF